MAWIWKRSGQLICCPKNLLRFTEGGSKVIAIFHQETLLNAVAPAAKHGYFRCKVGAYIMFLQSIIIKSHSLKPASRRSAVKPRPRSYTKGAGRF